MKKRMMTLLLIWHLAAIFIIKKKTNLLLRKTTTTTTAYYGIMMIIIYQRITITKTYIQCWRNLLQIRTDSFIQITRKERKSEILYFSLDQRPALISIQPEKYYYCCYY